LSLTLLVKTPSVQSFHWNQPVVIATFDVFSDIVAEHFDYKSMKNMPLTAAIASCKGSDT
jgi:hypothetical protein